MLKRAREKIKQRDQEKADADGGEDDDMESLDSSSDDLNPGQNEESDEEPKAVANMVIPKVMPTVNDDSSDEGEEARSFLANTMSLIKEKDDARKQSKGSSIAADLDSLFGKHF